MAIVKGFHSHRKYLTEAPTHPSSNRAAFRETDLWQLKGVTAPKYSPALKSLSTCGPVMAVDFNELWMANGRQWCHFLSA